MERKFFKLKLESLDESGNFTGYGAVFGNVDAYKDIIDPGAFKRTIKNHNQVIPILFNHDPNKEIALTSAMAEDEHGLLLSGKLYISDDAKMDLKDARETYIKMKQRQAAGKPIGMSIGYDTVQDYKDKDDQEIRHLKEIKLWETSIVTFPANELATITGIKSLDEDELSRLIQWCKNIDEIELKEGRVLSSSNRTLVSNAIEALQALLEASEPRTDSVSDLGQKCQGLAEELQNKLKVLEWSFMSSKLMRTIGG